jgi:uncharacterized protein (TIRG00374 family)
MWLTLAMGLILLVGAALLVRPQLLISLIGQAYRVLGRHGRLFGRVRRLVRDTSDLFQPVPLAVGVGLGSIGWLMECGALFVCANVIGEGITIEQAIFIFTFANLVGALSMLPGGIGGTEVSMAALLIACGLSFEQASAVTLVIRVGTLWFGIACGYVALFAWMYRKNPHSVERKS